MDTTASGCSRQQDLAHSQLVVGVGVGVQEADADRGDALVAEPPRRPRRRPLVEGAHLLAAEVESAPDGFDPVGGHDARRLDPEVGVAVAVGHALPGDLQDELVALGGDEAELADLALEQLVGGDGGAVATALTSSPRRAQQLEDLATPAMKPSAGLPGVEGVLVVDDLARVLVERDDVGERAAGVDADADVASRGIRGRGHGDHSTRDSLHVVRLAIGEPHDGAPQRLQRVDGREVAGTCRALLEVQVAAVWRTTLTGARYQLAGLDVLAGDDLSDLPQAWPITKSNPLVPDLQAVPAVCRTECTDGETTTPLTAERTLVPQGMNVSMPWCLPGLERGHERSRE